MPHHLPILPNFLEELGSEKPSCHRGYHSYPVQSYYKTVIYATGNAPPLPLPRSRWNLRAQQIKFLDKPEEIYHESVVTPKQLSFW